MRNSNATAGAKTIRTMAPMVLPEKGAIAATVRALLDLHFWGVAILEVNVGSSEF